METSVKLTKKDELNFPIFQHLLYDMISVFGSVEITIKPQHNLNSVIVDRIKAIDNGEEMIYFDADEFEKVSKDLILRKIPDKKLLKKVYKNEKGNIIPNKSL